MQFMNKTYLIFTLILLSACSQPKYDGFWHDEEYGDDVAVKITGNVFEFFELGFVALGFILFFRPSKPAANILACNK